MLAPFYCRGNWCSERLSNLSRSPCHYTGNGEIGTLVQASRFLVQRAYHCVSLLPRTSDPHRSWWLANGDHMCLGWLGKKCNRHSHQRQQRLCDSLVTVIKSSCVSDRLEDWEAGGLGTWKHLWDSPTHMNHPSPGTGRTHGLLQPLRGLDSQGPWWARCYPLPFASKIPGFLAGIDGGGIKEWYNGVGTFNSFLTPI